MSLNRYLKSHTLQFHSVYQSDTAFLIILCKDNASERKESLLSVSRAQLILCKDNASERKESLLSVSRAQLILCKVKKKSRNRHCRPQNRFKRGAIPPKMQPRQAKPRPKRREMPTKTPQKSNRPKRYAPNMSLPPTVGKQFTGNIRKISAYADLKTSPNAAATGTDSRPNPNPPDRYSRLCRSMTATHKLHT